MDIQGLQLLESCAYTWVFDGATRLFRRFPREARVGLDALIAWTPYHQLEVDNSRSCLVVALDETRTRILRAWLHQNPCDRCTPQREALVDSKHRVQHWKECIRIVDGRQGSQRRHPLRPFGGRPQRDGAV